MPKNLNYNRDIIKHYVRFYGWIHPFKTILNYVDTQCKKGHRTEKCKYLTFCAVQAVDVFLFEYKKYLFRNNNTNRLENVYFCENDEESFTLIQKIIGSADQGFFGNFQEVILQDENEPIINSEDPFDEPELASDREKLRLIELKKRLTAKFPFDVINLDFYGNFFPSSESRYSDSFQTYKQVLELQKLINGHKCERFLMYLTLYTPVFNQPRFVNNDVMVAFEKVLLENLAYPEFEDALNRKYGHNNPKSLDVYLKFILGFLKLVIFKETYKLGWKPKIKNVLCYDRIHSDDRPHKEATFVVEYTRASDLDNFQDFEGNIHRTIENDYKRQLVDLVINKPEQVPTEDKIPQEVIENLRVVVEFRNKFLKDINVYSDEIFS
jgi:hypothetical protein